MALSAVASAQALSEITLVAQAAASGQPQRQLAVNLRGDLVLLLQDRVEGGSRHQAIVALVQRQPGMLLDLPGALRQVDELALDCHAGTRTVWRSEAYRAGDPTAQPSRSLRLDPEQRRTDALADLALSNPLMAAALRTLCAGGGTVVQQPEPKVPASPTAPATPVAPIEPGSIQPPSNNVPPGTQGPPAGSPSPPVANNGPSWINAPIFPGSAFSLRTLARLAQGTYTSPAALQAETEVAAVLSDVLAQLESRPTPHQSLKVMLTRQSLDVTLRKQGGLERNLADKAALLEEVGLQAMALPPMVRRAPASFVAELYRHNASGQYVLAFRGSAEAADWVSNLWMGVDLGEVTSPHYAAADELVAELRRRGISPLVLGHSLGGGMAQYVAYRHSLRMVGFNPSPLPVRYLSGKNYDVTNARLFTALELPAPGTPPSPEHDQRLGDPLSLGLDSLRKQSARAEQWIKASRQLVKPVCLLTLPEPYFDAEEDADLSRAVGQYFVSGPLQTLLTASTIGTVKKVSKGLAISKGLEALLDDPAWIQAGAGHGQAGVEAQKRAVVAGVQQAQALQSMGKALGWLYSASTGKNMGKTAMQVSVGVVDMMAAVYVKRMLQVHGMARFLRGLGAYGDLSPYALAPDGSSPCSAVSSTY
ncbi:YqiA/YcfP family alpha/beta fold hydrolase [Paucibacter sp. AS339]|uniref:YqiA/YcfP family alpha/beta fold hydrolase n=1 Tax=Paucibacter hankyongi TaxID=3133434 RepID=UPI00309ED610